MSKTKTKRSGTNVVKPSKRPSDDQTNGTAKKRPKQDDAAAEAENLTLGTVISDEELEIAVDTLNTLSQHPSLIKSKGCKDLRAAVYTFRQACTTGMNTTNDGTNGKSTHDTSSAGLTARISAALADGQYTDAIVALAEMRIRGLEPKLGALCRWVRELDAVSGLSSDHLPALRSARQVELLRVLDMILRVTGPVEAPSASIPWPPSEPIALQTLWDLRDKDVAALPVRESVLDGSIFKHCEGDVKSKFHVIETTPGPERKPPNLHPAVIYLTDDNTVAMDATPPSITRHEHPRVPNLTLLKDVLSRDECQSIIAATESIGYLPDAPIRQDDTSILAHNVYWMVDRAFHDKLWARVLPFIPERLQERKARGINRRFRVYRYVPGAEYRCHFDGGWPPSGVDPVTGKYVYDASPSNAKQSSLFTFLVYLNDEFEGGETTFFTPSVVEGVMNADPVRPVMGAVALFPHGEAKGALLHEGTGVRKGAKYIIRTDVEYDVEAGEE
jgi:hypothetical protein